MKAEDLAAVAPIGTFIVAACAFIVGLVNRHHIQAIHIDINSRLTQLLEANSAASHAEGVAQGEQDQRNRQGGIE